MKFPRTSALLPGLAATLAASIYGTALATEGGGGMYPNGNENYLVGAMPPPGNYVLEYFGADHLTSLRDNGGHRVNVPFDVKATYLSTRFVHVTGTQILGGQLAWHVIAPLVNLDVNVAGSGQTHFGLGDMVFGPGLGYHDGALNYVFALDINAPTGHYDKTDLANIGRNYWNLEPLIAISYVQPSGLNADIKFHYDINFKNKATDYTSGQEFHFDHDIGWGLGNGWVVGVGGYFYQQVTVDRQYGATVPDNKGHALGLGPSVKYENGKGFFITAKWQKDFDVRNRAEGSSIKVKFDIPF